jgi:hypothetical protein
MRFSSGTSQSSNTTSLGTDAVRMVRMFRAVNPFMPFSTMKQLMPARPLPESVRQNTTPQGASWAREMKILVPLMTQRSPFFSARQRMAPAGSEPPEGSVMAQKLSCPCSMHGTAYFSICALVPAQIAGGGLRPNTPQPVL